MNHHHPHLPHHHHHPHPHAGVAIGPLPNQCIGMVAAPTAGGPVIAGIGVPLMTAAPTLVGPPPPPNQHQQSHPSKNLGMSPDSTDDKDKCGGHPFIQARTSPSGPTAVGVSCSTATGVGSQLTWTTAPAGSIMSGIAYPVMGLPPGALTGDANAAATGMIYGVPIGDHQVSAGVNVNSVISLPANSPAVVTAVPAPPTAMSLSSVIHPQQQNVPTASAKNSSGVSSGAATQQESPSPHQQPPKEIMHCKHCTLFPPNPNAPPPTTREKPPGCRTAFVGGLPENITEDIVREIFERCGEITTIRMSKKNFCHIRFETEQYVELALYFSGYRIRIGSNSDSANIGRLHVDYAQARDDLYEWECRQRQLLREQRHRERLEQERLHPLSPPPTVHYSDHEAANVAERIKGDDTFMKAVQTLFAWLEKGECMKKNSNTFYSMIQSTNSQIRRLLNEKSQYEEDFQKAKDLVSQRMTGLLLQFTQLEKVFSAACQRKVWDHFSKAQRKNIEVWKKQVAEIKTVLLEEALNERTDEEMEFSDLESDSSGQSNKENGEPPRAKKMRLSGEEAKTVHQLKEENDALRCQLEASKNEVDLIKADLRSELDLKDQQLKSLQQQVMEVHNRISYSPNAVPTMCPPVSAADSMTPSLQGNSSGSGVVSPSTEAVIAIAKQNLHSPPSSVTSSGSPRFGMSPNHQIQNQNNTVNWNGKAAEVASGPTPSNRGCSSVNCSNAEPPHGFCDSSSCSSDINASSSNNAPNLNSLQLQPLQLQSSQNTQLYNRSGGSAGSGSSQSNSENIADNCHEVFDFVVNDGNQSSGRNSVSSRNESSSNSISDQAIIGINEKEAKLLGVISTFLHVHPFGASLDYIWSYTQKVLPTVHPNQIDILMTKFPSLFKQEMTGIGASLERKWVFVGFS